MKNEMEQLIDQMITGGILFDEARQEFEKRFILKMMDRYKNNLSKAAVALGIHRNTLSKRVEQYKNGKIEVVPVARKSVKRRRPASIVQNPGLRARK